MGKFYTKSTKLKKKNAFIVYDVDSNDDVDVKLLLVLSDFIILNTFYRSKI